ncbi:MAG: GcvT family protein [Geminicoccaceae bacterium]
MRDHAQVVVIGGGIVGCSVLHHLVLLGWQDVMLLEKAELTAGTTWRAAGHVSRFDLHPNMIKLRDDSVQLYEKLASDPKISFKTQRTGGMILATSEGRFQELKLQAARGRSLGMPHLIMSRREIADHHPLIDPIGIVGGLYDPLAGHVDAYDLTHALAYAAEEEGAEIHQQTAVIAMSQEPDGSWLIITDRGEVAADVVVNAAGLWANDIMAMIGLDVPMVAIEHQYAITEDVAEIQAVDGQLPSLCDPDASILLRCERDDVLIDAYGDEAKSRTTSGMPSDFGGAPLPGVSEHLKPYFALAAKRMPCLKDVALRSPISGPMTVTPDGRPLLGPLPGFRNFFVACGFMNGLSLAGGAGKALAEWIIEGEPPIDLFMVDVTRFGAFARKSYTMATAKEAYRRFFAIEFPHQRLPAGRPLKRTAIHDQLAAKGAQFDALFGWERPCWFAQTKNEREAVTTFKRGSWFEAVGRESRGVRRAVGIADLTMAFAKHVIEGPEVEAILDRMLASPLPAAVGKIDDALMLNRQGRIAGLFTLARISDEGFYLIGPAAAERFHQRCFEQHLPDSGIIYAPVSVRYAVLAIAGPKARILLARVTHEDVSDKALPHQSMTEIEVAGAPALVMRIALTGDLAYQIHVPMEYQATVYEALFVAGQDLDLIDVGALALTTLGLEAGHDHFFSQKIADLTPSEADLEGLIDPQKPDFIGKAALDNRRHAETGRRRALVEVDADDADVLGGEPVYHENGVVGSVITGGYGHNVEMSLAQVLVPVELKEPGTRFVIDILGEKRSATVLEGPPLNPDDQPLSI